MVNCYEIFCVKNFICSKETYQVDLIITFPLKLAQYVKCKNYPSLIVLLSSEEEICLILLTIIGDHNSNVAQLVICIKLIEFLSEKYILTCLKYLIFLIF